MNNYSRNLNQRDRELLHFLWTWKVATTAALTQRFFSDRSPHTAYKRLWELESSKYILAVSDFQTNHHVWTLTKLGFHIVRRDLPALREDGFRSENISHDLITSAIHLGGYLLGTPTDVALFSEQELRRLHLEFYPDWVPRSELHRPDGYWRVPVGNPMATVALEVELSRKKTVQYEIVADFYASYPAIIRVLWLVARPSMGMLIHDKIGKALSNSPMIHNFVSLPKFLKSGWTAVIEHGPEQGKPITTLLGRKSPASPLLLGEKLLLDTRKSAYKSRVLRPLNPGCFRY